MVPPFNVLHYLVKVAIYIFLHFALDHTLGTSETPKGDKYSVGQGYMWPYPR